MKWNIHYLRCHKLFIFLDQNRTNITNKILNILYPNNKILYKININQGQGQN